MDREVQRSWIRGFLWDHEDRVHQVVPEYLGVQPIQDFHPDPNMVRMIVDEPKELILVNGVEGQRLPEGPHIQWLPVHLWSPLFPGGPKIRANFGEIVDKAYQTSKTVKWFTPTIELLVTVAFASKKEHCHGSRLLFLAVHISPFITRALSFKKESEEFQQTTKLDQKHTCDPWMPA